MTGMKGLVIRGTTNQHPNPFPKGKSSPSKWYGRLRVLIPEINRIVRYNLDVNFGDINFSKISDEEIKEYQGQKFNTVNEILIPVEYMDAIDSIRLGDETDEHNVKGYFAQVFIQSMRKILIDEGKIKVE